MNDVTALTEQEFLALIRYNDQGLVPVVVQDVSTQQVLMHAWMNQEAVALTLQRKQAVFWSRTRREIWHKGATSGNWMDVEDLVLDCDGDTLLLWARPAGPACHTGQITCFFRRLA